MQNCVFKNLHFSFNSQSFPYFYPKLIGKSQKLIDLDFNTTQKPKPGALLIAEPFASDDYFRRSVVLICDYNEKGSFGFVLNNYLEVEFNELSEEKLDINTRVSIGGPVDTNNLYYIHRYGDRVKDSFKINKELSLGGDYKQLMALLRSEKNPEKKARFFLGYAGWTEKQLDQEIENKFWVVMNPKSNSSLMDTSVASLWKECLNQLGGRYKVFTHFPINPNNN